MNKSVHSFMKTATIITAITLISKLFGFLREALIAYYFGTSMEVDMYLMAVNIPTILLGFITCIGTALTPVYTEISVNEGSRKSLGFLMQLILAMLGICIGVTIICISNAEFIIDIIAPGFNEEMKAMTADYLKISMWNLLITTIMNIFICYLNCNGKYIYASTAMLFHSSVQIIFTYFAYIIGPIFLTVGYLLANIFYLLALIFFSIKAKFIIVRPYFNINYEKMLIKLVVPIGISSLVTQINGYVDKFFATNLAIGSISALHYSNTIRTFIVMMLNTGLITMFYPVISRLVSEKKFEKVRDTLSSSINYIMVTFIPVTILLLFFADVITEILFQRGAFNSESVATTSEAIRMYIVGITAVALRDVFSNYFYSVKHSSFTLAVSIIEIIVNIIINIILVERMGVGGLALATSISVIISIPIYIFRISREPFFKGFGMEIVRILAKCCIANLPAFLLLALCNHFVSEGGIFISLIISLIYLIVYFVFLKILKFKEVELITDIWNRILSKIFKI